LCPHCFLFPLSVCRRAMGKLKISLFHVCLALLLFLGSVTTT
jgi:hypothetical protein